MIFADKIKFARAKLLISQKELAKQLGVSFVTVSRWENKKLLPTFLNEKRFEAFCNDNKIKFEEK